MRIFITGASGWIGSATAHELIESGHQVLGLARSNASAGVIEAYGGEVLRGDLEDLDSLRAGAAVTDGVVHMGYNHDFSQMGAAAQTDLAAINAFGEVLAGTDRPLVIAGGTLGLAPGRVGTEKDNPPAGMHPRTTNSDATLALAHRGVRSMVARFAPTVHGPGDHGFIARLVAIARAQGVSGYVGDGSHRWSAIHRLDAGRLVSLAVQNAPAGTVLHAIAEEGVTTRDIAEAIGRGLGLPTVSVPASEAMDHFDWLGRFFGADAPASNTITRELLGWAPTHQGLIADLDAGYYFQDATE